MMYKWSGALSCPSNISKVLNQAPRLLTGNCHAFWVQHSTNGLDEGLEEELNQAPRLPSTYDFPFTQW